MSDCNEFKLACVRIRDVETEESISKLSLQSPEHGSAVQQERDTKIRKQSVKSHTSSSSDIGPDTPTTSFRRKPPPVSPARSITPEVIQVGLLVSSNFDTLTLPARR